MSVPRKIGMCLAIAFVSSICFSVGGASALFAWENWLPRYLDGSEPSFKSLLLDHFRLLMPLYLVIVATSVPFGWSRLDNLSWPKAFAASVTSAVLSYILLLIFSAVPFSQAWVRLFIMLCLVVGVGVCVLVSLRYFDSLPERTTRKFLALALGLIALLLVGRTIWYVYKSEWYAEFKTSSSVARWWRCQGTSRPFLASGTRSWKLHYSLDSEASPLTRRLDDPFAQSFVLDSERVGSLTVALSNSGSLIARSKKHGQADWTEWRIHLSQEEINELARVADDTGLLCQSSEMREGYMVIGSGRYTVQVVADGWTHEVVVDSCHTVPDLKAWYRVLAVLRKHPELPEEIYRVQRGLIDPGSCTRAELSAIATGSEKAGTR